MPDDDHRIDSQPPGLEEIGAFLAEEWPRLRAFVRLHMGAELRAAESASDIVQEVCIELLRQHADFEWRGRESFRRWLFVTALHKVRQHLRRAAVRRRFLGSPKASDLRLSECYARIAEPLDDLTSKEAIERLEAAFDALPEHYAEIITLRRIVGLSYETLAEDRGTTPAAVRVLMHRALARLAALLDRPRN